VSLRSSGSCRGKSRSTSSTASGAVGLRPTANHAHRHLVNKTGTNAGNRAHSPIGLGHEDDTLSQGQSPKQTLRSFLPPQAEPPVPRASGRTKPTERRPSVLQNEPIREPDNIQQNEAKQAHLNVWQNEPSRDSGGNWQDEANRHDAQSRTEECWRPGARLAASWGRCYQEAVRP
jgi:hypothetical protein